MNKILFLSFFFLSSVFAQSYDNSFYGNSLPPGYGPGAMGGGLGGNPNFTASNGASVPMFETTNAGSNFNQIKPNASCPLLTQAVKEDQDAFLDIKNYLSSFSRKPECAQNSMGAMMSGQSVSMLENMLGSNANTGMKCYSKNVEQISSRNMAFYYADKGIDQSLSSPYASCNSKDLSSTGAVTDYSSAYTAPVVVIPVSKDKIQECISKKYDSIVEDNQQICKEVVAPQAVQDQINKGMVELERLLVQSLSQDGQCAPDAKDAFKATMNTFLKVKALSAVGPWGAMAGFGADLIGSLLDRIFPNDSQKASALMSDILSEDNYEQNACLYFNIQQKMYCANQPLFVTLPSGSCNNVNVNGDMLKLLQNIKDMKKIADAAEGSVTPSAVGIYNPGSMSGVYPSAGGTGAMNGSGGFGPQGSSADLSKFESGLDDLTKYAIASEADIRTRIQTLPKIQQSKELVKINRFYELLNAYQAYDPSKDQSGEAGQKILTELNVLVVGVDKNQKINFEELVLKTTPGLKVDTLKQRGIASSIEQMLEKNTVSSNPSAETSRSMAKYNKYKNAMGTMAQNQFESRLGKQFKEFETQVKFVTSKEGGVANDTVAEGMLRNLVRHCTLMQEIYDPNIEGKIPKQCEKLGCGKSNKLGWFMPKNNQANFTQYKTNYCDKAISYKKIEDDYVKELNSPAGAKICGKKPEEFF